MNTSPKPSSSPQRFLRRRPVVLLIQVVVVFALGYLSAGWVRKAPESVSPAEAAGKQTWICAMHPQIISEKPGKCPICGMPLVLAAAEPSSATGMRNLTVTPAARELMEIETVPVERRYVTAEVRMVGKIEYDETRLAHITAWVPGRLDRLYVDYTGVQVRPGDHLVSIYSEQLYAAQVELIQALRFERERPTTRAPSGLDVSLADSSREKLRLLGMTAEQIAELEQRGTPLDHVTIYSPFGGIVLEKLKQEGDRVNVGDRIYTVADLREVWVKLDAYESDLEWLRYGQSVSFTTTAYPGETFHGRIAFIDPVLNEATRTVKVRVNVPNEDGRLKPEMFVSAVVRSQVAGGGRVLDPSLAGKWISPMHPEIVKDEPGTCDLCGMPLVRAETLGYVTADTDPASRPLVIPVTAALVTGKRAIVYVQLPDRAKPTYEGREIVLGPRAGDYYLVRQGLTEGELVVTHGNFKIDSALQIQGKPSMMTPEGGGGGGHHHGAPPSEAKPEQAPSSEQPMHVPPEFLGQLAELDSAFDEVTAAVGRHEFDETRSAFATFASRLDAVDGTALVDHAAMLWKEFQMLLSNDAFLGSEAKDTADADEAYRALAHHMERLREQLGATHAGHAPVAIPGEFAEQLSTLWRPYNALAESLAAGDPPATHQAIVDVQNVTATIDSTALEADALAAWQREEANLTTITGELERAADLQSVRAAFAELSEEMEVLVREFGVHAEAPLFRLHCPMAFEGRGAIWLQADDQPRNPYFGAAMLKCADRIEPISHQAAPPPHEMETHEGHQHG